MYRNEQIQHHITNQGKVPDTERADISNMSSEFLSNIVEMVTRLFNGCVTKLC